MADKWTVRTEILFPLVTKLVDENGNFLPYLEFKRRYTPGQSVSIDGVEVRIEEWASEASARRHEFQGITFESAALVCSVFSESWHEANTLTMPAVEWACDQLSFFSQSPISVISSQISTDSEPERVECMALPMQPAKFRSTRYTNARMPDHIPLWPKPPGISERDLAALRWYHKALAAQYDVDRFVFLWVCLEVLSHDSAVIVKEGYRADCGCLIERCPHCDRSVEKKLNGRTLKKYLNEGLSVSKKDSARLWQFRQLLHGQNKLTEDKTKDTSELVIKLQAAVCRALKPRLGLSERNPPVVTDRATGVTAMGLSILKDEDK